MPSSSEHGVPGDSLIAGASDDDGTTAAFADYETTRDNLSRRLFEITELRVQIRRNDGTTVLEGETWCFTFADSGT